MLLPLYVLGSWVGVFLYVGKLALYTVDVVSRMLIPLGVASVGWVRFLCIEG